MSEQRKAFEQSTAARVTCVAGQGYALYWCSGCKPKAHIHKTHSTALHIQPLSAGESFDVPTGKKHWDGTTDTCELIGNSDTAWTVKQ